MVPGHASSLLRIARTSVWAEGPVGETARALARLRVDRLLVVVALLGSVSLLLVETPRVSSLSGVQVPLGLALVVLHVGALPFAFRSPDVAAPISLAAALVLQALSATTTTAWPWWPASIVTQSLVLAAVASRVRLLVALLHWVLAVVTSASLAALLRPAAGSETGVDVVVFGAIAATAVVLAFIAAQWRQVRSDLLRERRLAADEAAGRVLMEERARIARELHDVVAHSLSIITVQAATARFRHAEATGDVVEEFERIGDQSRRALDEMRGLLRVLRGSDDADRRPQPGILDIERLVIGAGASGASIVLKEPEGDWAGSIGQVTGLTAYRIVQEAISNSLRHAPGSAIEVALTSGSDHLEIAVVNGPGTSSVDRSTHGGHGLVGMTERAVAAGGTVLYGPTSDGGFAVRALLPLRSEGILP